MKLQRMISTLIWRRKIPKMKIKTPYNIPQCGRMKRPDFQWLLSPEQFGSGRQSK